MKQSSFAARLSQASTPVASPAIMQKTPLASSLANIGEMVNRSPASNQVTPVNNYTSVRNDDIRKSLEAAGMTQLVNPNEMELTYVNSVFQSKGFHKIENVTYDAVNTIGKAEFEDLNRKMKEFTSKMGGVNTAGIFDLIDEVSKGVAETDLESIYMKAVNAKPTLWALFLSLFDKNAKGRSIQQKLKALGDTLGANGKSLEVKLTSIEQDLSKQKQMQEKNVKDLEKSFEIYYNSFIELRKQYALIVYLEHSYKAQLDKFKADNSGSTDLVISKELQDYEGRYQDIQNKRLIIHKSMLQLPIIVQQNTNLVTVIKTLMKEIDNTLVSSFPLIRGNLQTIGVSIMTQKAMLGNNNAKELEKNLALMANRVTGDLAVAGATLSADLRLQEAQTVETLVGGLKTLTQRLEAAKEESQQKMNDATGILTNATNELKDLLGGKN